MRVVVAGAGIAGLSLAWWLLRGGHEVVVVERACRLRTEGYMIDFFGSGYDVAERVGLLPDLADAHYPIPHLTFLEPRGSVGFTLEYAKLRALFDDRHFNFMRGDLERVLYARVEGGVAFRFGATVRALWQDERRVQVTLGDGATLEADLFVGADGLHSAARELAFGDGAHCERFLGYHCAAFVLDAPPELGVRRDTFYTLTEPGRQVTLYPVRGDRLATFFIHRAERPVDAATRRDPRERLRHAFAGVAWVVPRLLETLEQVPEVYYDDVSQVVLPAWSTGRIALVGDACQCVSLLAGQGASMAMAGAYVLAESLDETRGDVARALARYEARVKPHIERKQRGGRRMARWFVPESGAAIVLRDVLTRMVAWPVVSAVARRRFAVESMFRGPAGGAP